MFCFENVVITNKIETVIKIILSINHRQPAFERGLSVNKNLLQVDITRGNTENVFGQR